MKEHPILFNEVMVRAILDGSKTQTRIVSNPQPEFVAFPDPHEKPVTAPTPSIIGANGFQMLKCPFEIGDRLWVREKFQPLWDEGIEYGSDERLNYKTGAGYYISYPATDGIVEFVNADEEDSTACKPSIHMPRWASRITLEIVNVRIERLNDISDGDAVAEGITWQSGVSWLCDYERHLTSAYRSLFADLWRSIYGETSWDENPWVWVIEFKKVGGNNGTN